MADNTIASKVKSVNEILLVGEPENVSVDTYSGYVGYKPQYIIDAMNEVFGYGEWGFEELSNEIAEGEKALLLVAKVKVSLKGIDFQPSGWGQARITKGDIGDARKGAQTDAIKKALSYFSIGNKAYKGLLDTKNTHGKSSTSQQSNQSKSVVESKSSDTKQIVHPQPSNNNTNMASSPSNEYRETRKATKAQEQSAQSQPPKDEEITAHLNKIYDLALERNVIKKGPSKEENGKNFLAFCSKVLNATITASGQLTKSRLDDVEKYLNSKPVAKAS